MSKPVKYSIVMFSILLLLILIPALVPLSKYKEVISTQVKNACGRELNIGGKISLSLLPRPKIKIEDVKLSSLPGAIYPNLIEFKTAEAAIAITPLFWGNIVISYIEVESPKITLEKLKNGHGTWEFENEKSSMNSNDKEKSTAASDQSFNINRIIVNNGEIIYLDGNNKTNVQNLNLDAKLKDIKGPIDFDLAFRILDQDISLNGKLKEITNVVPLQIELTSKLGRVKLDGTINVDNLSFKGDITSDGNLKNLKIIETSSLPAGLREDYVFSAKIEADKTQLKSDINFQTGKINAKGHTNFSIEKSAGNLELVLNPGNIIINIVPQDSFKDFMVSKVQLKSNSIKPMLEALKIDLKTVPEFVYETFFVAANLKFKDQELILENIDFKLGNANLQGVSGVKNWNKDLTIPYDLKTKNVAALLKLAGINLPFDLGDLQIKGETIKKDTLVKTATTLTLAKSDIKINGDMNLSKDVEPNVTVNISGDSLNQTISQFTKKPSIKNLGSFNINSKIHGNVKKEIVIDIEKSSAFLARERINLEGKATVGLDGSKPKISLNLLVSGTPLNMDLLTDSANSPESGNRSNIQGVPAKNHWSNEKINLSFLSNFDGDFNLSIQKITSGSLIFDNFNTKLSLKDGTLDLSSLTGNLYGGKIEATAKIASHKNGSGDLSFKASLNGAQLRNIVPTQGKIRITNGVVDFNTDIKTKGDSQYSYISNLNGTTNLNGKDGVLSGFDLQKIVNALNNIRDLQNILKVLDNSILKGETAFKSVENNIIINNGIAKLAVSRIVAKGGEANATGIIDLPKYLIDVNAEVKVDVKNIPLFKAHLYGQLDNPQYKLDTKALQEYLINNVLTGVIDNIKSGKTKPADILKGLIGGGKKGSEENNNNSSQGENNPKAPAEKNEVNDLISNGLKSLFK